MRVGFIGLGSQGAPMARRILEGGYPTALWARRQASVEPFADTAAQIAGSPAELAAASDLVCLCVVGDADVTEVVTGETGVLAGLKPGGVIAVHSTVHPDTCRQLAAQASEQGVSVVDAPVSGGGPAAARGTLLVMVGGDADVVARIRPVFTTYGDPIIHLGPVGSGQLTKLLNNLLFTANLATARTALALGEALGVAPENLAEVITEGSGNSYALGSIARFGGSLDVLKQVASGLLRKDVSLVADIAEKTGVAPGAVLDAADAALALMDNPRDGRGRTESGPA
jgi:6-phosphogluconate dehydrogenase